MEIKDIEEAVCATANKLDLTGLKSFTRLDFTNCSEYLASKGFTAKIRRSKYKGAESYFVAYNDKNISGSELTNADKRFGYKKKTDAQIELIHIAIKMFEINTNTVMTVKNNEDEESDPCEDCGKKSYDDYVQRYTYKSHGGFIDHIALCESCGFEFKTDRKFIEVTDI